MTVRSLLDAKGSHVPTVSLNARIREVLVRLEEEEAGALVVTENGVTVRGIISERDIVRGLVAVGDIALENDVQEMMTTDVVTCKPGDKVAAVMAMMLVNHIRHIPVVDDSRQLVGFIAIRDIIKHRLDEVQSDADAMQKYISG